MKKLVYDDGWGWWQKTLFGGPNIIMMEKRSLEVIFSPLPPQTVIFPTTDFFVGALLLDDLRPVKYIW